MQYNLSELLQQKLDACRSLREATNSLRKLAESDGDEDTVASLMEECASSVTAIDDIDGRIAEIWRTDPSFPSSMTGTERKRARKLAREIDDTVRETADRTTELEGALRHRRDAMAGQMTRIGHARHHLSRERGTPEPRFLNVRL